VYETLWRIIFLSKLPALAVWTIMRIHNNHVLMAFSTLLLLLSPAIVSAFVQSFPPPVDRRILDTMQEVEDLMWDSSMIETSNFFDGAACNVSASLGYLRSHLNLHVISHVFDRLNSGWSKGDDNHDGVAAELLSLQPLLYSFYLENVLQPYGSRIEGVSEETTTFCTLDRIQEVCEDKEKKTGCKSMRDGLVCLPNSDATTEGKCVTCTNLKTELEKARTTVKNESTIGYLKATCDPGSREPKPPPPVPARKPGDDEKTTKEEVRWLRWFLESSFVFEGKKSGDNCSATPELSKARFHLDVLMKKHFGKRKLSLRSGGMVEGPEDEAAYEAVRAELSDDKQRKFYEEKLMGIEKEKKMSFGEVYCSREEGLVCVEWKCRPCGEERVRKNEDLVEACDLKDDGGKGGFSSTEGSTRKKGSSGAQNGKLMSPEFTAILGMFFTISGLLHS
jgi:hypothetical protein